MNQHEVYDSSDQVPFRQNSVIGYGAVGVVDEVLGTRGPFRSRIYARKIIVLVDDPAAREAELREIENEVAIMREASHDHIVKVVATYMLSNNYGIVMDPRADGHLEKFLRASTPEAPVAVSSWFACLLSAVAYIHQNNITHRDIKPLNILVKDGAVLLSDFGISTMGLGVTVPTTILGRPRGRTPEYCAPEVEMGRTRRRSADMFSLGAVFLEMATVCSYSDDARYQLDRLRGRLHEGGRQSYALKTQRLEEWMDEMLALPLRPVWQATILDMCRDMLQDQERNRPKASDVRSLWLVHSLDDLPPTACRCIHHT